MINLKKYTTYAQRFVLFLTIAALTACSPVGYRNTKIEAKKIAISAEMAQGQNIESYISPYRNRIEKDLDSVLAYAPETFDKSKGKWQTTIGNLLADATFTKADALFYAKEGKHIDACMLNHGSIRSVIAKGNVTARTAFEVMPFENNLVVTALKGEQIREMADYIAREQKPHPLAGMLIILDANGMVKSITIQDKALENNKIYYIATIDYLVAGGDKMEFFAKNEGVYDLDCKQRDLYIDYFKAVDTLPVITTQRIIKE
jgi:2',3'-cyclic-nucleotide 2'-phosphodiesterase (5'-nucleotidase family)